MEGKAETKTVEEVLQKDKNWLADFTIVIAHNLEKGSLEKLSAFLWQSTSYPPLVVVRSAGFLAEFYIQYHEHTGKFCKKFYHRLVLTLH